MNTVKISNILALAVHLTLTAIGVGGLFYFEVLSKIVACIIMVVFFGMMAASMLFHWRDREEAQSNDSPEGSDG